jgi:hypothetical protein
MYKKTSKHLVFFAVLLVVSLLLAAHQTTTTSAEERDRANGHLSEVSSDDPTEAEVVVDAPLPGIEMRRTWVEERTFLTIYSVRSEGPAWVVFHEDEDGEPGAILDYIWVGSGNNSIEITASLEEISAEPNHVMLHYDFARIGRFEFPGPDAPVVVDNEMVNELCFCPF